MDETRLVGAGRLCVAVPAHWPTMAWGRVTRSHVRVLRSTSIPAVGFPAPPADVVVVEPRAMTPRRTRNLVVPVSGWRPEVVAGHDAWVLVQWMHRERWSVRISSDALDAWLDVDGPRAVCERLVAEARPVPEGWAAVPNVWTDHHGQGYGHVARDDVFVRTLLTNSGLRARLTGAPLGEETHVARCEPVPTSVVPVGTEVVVTVEPYED